MPPVLYSFRRCPYAMRARLALASAGVEVALREIVLRDKAAAFLATSPSATVPCLAYEGGVIDESLDVMKWALAQSDPEGWLDMPAAGWDWIARCDGPFKEALDRTKYAVRYPDENALEQRDLAAVFLSDLEAQMGAWIFARASLADYAILPFVRQFANVDRAWFDAQPWPNVQAWLARFLASARFEGIMQKYTKWEEGDAPLYFP
ncbi:MAG: glutathione S-transferase [Paracoccaceae bacterium]